MKKVWIISGSIICSIIAAIIYDLIKSYPLLTTIKNLFIWVWENIINANIKIWIVFLLFALIYTLTRIIRFQNKAANSQPKYFNYKTDQFNGVIWKWDYVYNQQTDKYNINNLIPMCPKCDTRMHYRYGLLNTWEATCPRCSHHIARMKDREDIIALIVDNIDRDKFNI